MDRHTCGSLIPLYLKRTIIIMHPAKQFYTRVLKNFFPPVRFAFAYGSAVFQQYGKTKGKMLDLVFAVDDPVEWHQANLKCNRHHYSGLKHLGHKRLAYIQRLPAAVYYNTLVEVDSQLLKYGVISVDDLCEDLNDWTWLYVSGRLHKPVIVLTDLNSEARISKALTRNLQSATLCALLLMKGKDFNKERFYTTVASLSYDGDFRMVVGEDKNKIRNIVKPNIEVFEKLYNYSLAPFTGGSEHLLECSNLTVDHHLLNLPLCVKCNLHEGRSLPESISRIVRSSSIQQSAKGILTAGIKKTVVYSFEKARKMLSSLFYK